MPRVKHRPNIVILVDNKKRDLLGSAFLSYHLDKLGIDCHLEPLEATFASLAAYEPDLIVFNHLSAAHLSAYTQKLKELGVIVALLPNEGLGYTKTSQDLVTLKAHVDSHVDVYFCWNESLAEAVRRNARDNIRRVEVVGVPRFDFYFEPWSRLFTQEGAAARKTRPVLLVCTNYVFADYIDRPEAAQALFGNWASYVPGLADYKTAIEINYRNRSRLMEFLEPLLASNRYDLVLRPHPAENIAVYARMIESLEPALRANIRLSQEKSITPSILASDLEISMDSCTTALESWLAGKPTLEIDLEHHPILTQDLLKPLNVQCSRPEDILRQVEEALADPTQPVQRPLRATHIDKWCHNPTGMATFKVAEAIRDAIERRGPLPPLSKKLGSQDKRRALKLKMLRFIDRPYNWQPQMVFRRLWDQEGSYIRWKDQDKAIRPSDVAEIGRRLARAYDSK